MIKSARTDILNLQFIKEKTWSQCTLPTKDGGLGVRSAQEVALPAFLSSVQGTLSTTCSLLPPEVREGKNEFFF